MANPQTENGYTKIANELLDKLILIQLSANEWQVLLCIIRKTYGFQKKVDKIASTQIVEHTGLDKYVVSKVLNRLSDKNIIIRDGKRLGVQKDWELWKLSKQTTSEAKDISNNQDYDDKLSEQTTNTEINTHEQKLSKQTTNSENNLTKSCLNRQQKVVQTDNKKLSKQTTTKEKKEKKEKGISKDIPSPKIVDIFHELCPSLHKIREITKPRKERLRIICRDNKNPEELLRELFTKTEASDFLTGRIKKLEGHSNWCCNFDWIIKAENMTKILEGVYDNRKEARRVIERPPYTGR